MNTVALVIKFIICDKKDKLFYECEIVYISERERDWRCLTVNMKLSHSFVCGSELTTVDFLMKLLLTIEYSSDRDFAFYKSSHKMQMILNCLSKRRYLNAHRIKMGLYCTNF